MATKKSVANSAIRKRAPTRRAGPTKIAAIRPEPGARSELPDEGQLEQESMGAGRGAANEEEE